jgi:hypothetical protein
MLRKFSAGAEGDDQRIDSPRAKYRRECRIKKKLTMAAPPPKANFAVMLANIHILAGL